MTKQLLTGAEILVDEIHKQGIEYIFGYPGGAAIPMFDALVDSPVELILSRHEQGATHMADGYARATGIPGVVLVTSGPGATNTVTGILTAHMDSCPMVIICGQSGTTTLGLDAFQEADVSGMTFPVVKHSYLIKNPEDIPRVIREAFHLAKTGRPGPVLIDIPKDISASQVDPTLPSDYHLPGYHVPEEGDQTDIEKAAELLSRAQRPVLLVGHGAVISGAEKAVAHMAEKLQIPVLNTLLGKGCFPETHEFNLGMPGMHGTAYANMALLYADLIMSIGSRWDDRIISNKEDIAKKVKIHVDIDPSEIDKIVKVDCSIVGDARLVIESINAIVKKGSTESWIKQVKRWKRDYPLKYRKEGKLKPQHPIEEVFKLTEGKAVFVTDVGQHQMWAAQYCLIDKRFHWISSGGAGTMGFGFPAAIGAQMADKEKTVVAIVGDGGFQMTLCELATAVRLKLPIKIILINNGYLGMVRQWQHLFFDNRLSGVALDDNPNFVKLAESYGCKAYHIKRSADVRKVLRQALSYNDGPCLVDVHVERTDNVYPFIPAGASYRDMLLEPAKKTAAKEQ